MTNDYILGLGCLAMLTSIGAQALGRSGFWWFLFAIFTGPVATFCLMFAGKNDDDEEEEIEREGT